MTIRTIFFHFWLGFDVWWDIIGFKFVFWVGFLTFWTQIIIKNNINANITKKYTVYSLWCVYLTWKPGLKQRKRKELYVICIFIINNFEDKLLHYYLQPYLNQNWSIYHIYRYSNFI